MLLAFGKSRGFRVAVGMLTGVAAVALIIDTADARGRRHHRTVAAKGGGYSPPYAAIVVDANSGQVLHAAEPDGIRHPASLTKIMTLYLLFERMEAGKIKEDTPLRVSTHAASQNPTKLGVKPGQTLTADEAIRGLVTRSANDAAVVIAEAIAGDEDTFAKMMTRKARALGMSRTVYRNASGLPDPDQVTSARDQALLGRAIQDRFPNYYRYFSIPSFTFRGNVIANHNHLLGSVQGVDGIKTGYVQASGFNLVTSMRRNNRHLVAVVMGGSSAGARDAKMRSLLEKYVQEASVRRTAPMIAENRDAETDAAPAPRVMLASAASVPAPAPSPAADAPMPVPAKPVAAAARLDSNSKGETARPVNSPDPIKPILVKTIKVKLNGAQTASLTPPLAHLPMVPVQDEPARAAKPSQPAPHPAQVPQPAPVRAAAPAAQPASAAAPTSTPVQTVPAQAVPAKPVAAPIQVAAAPGAIAPPPAAPTPVVHSAAVPPAPPAPPPVTAQAPVPAPVPAPAPIQVQAAPAPAPVVAQPAPAREPQREVAVATGDPDSTFALASAASRPEEPAARTEDPARKVVRSGWIIQIGAFGDESEAKSRLSSAQAKAKQALAHADPFTEAVTKDNKTFYRARFAGFDEKDSAEAACKTLKRADFACLPIKN